MTDEQFQNAQQVDDTMVVFVKDHKTNDSYGPAQVVLMLYKRIYRWLIDWLIGVLRHVNTR